MTQLKDVIPKEKWAIRKAAQESHNFFQEGSKQTIETSSITSTSNSKNNVNESKANKIAWANTHLVMASTTSMQNKILLDSDSTTTVFCNEDYCDTIKSSETVEIKKNGGTMLMNESCMVPDLGKGYFNKNRLTNIIGLTNMRKKFRVTYDSSKEPAFLIHTKNGIIRFPEIKRAVYAIDMDEKKPKKKPNKKSPKTRIQNQ